MSPSEPRSIPLKREKRSVTGVLLLDKPVGISSNGALSRIKALYNTDKAGHTGTLDPFASGLLPVCLGEATKFAGFMLDADKTYEATIRLGRTTTTGDREGVVLTEFPVQVTETSVREALGRFTGKIRQTPPMYSAIKFHGQPLYRLARQGLEISREAREITIYRIDLIAIELPLVKVCVNCSKGTYIRVLAEDIGRYIGCGGTLEELRRTGTGNFALADALSVTQLNELPLEGRDAKLLNPDRLVFHLPRLTVDEGIGRSLLEGKIVPAASGLQPNVYRAYTDESTFLGLVGVVDGTIKAQRMMSAPFVLR